MCGGGFLGLEKPKVEKPKVIKTSPIADQEKIDAEAAIQAAREGSVARARRRRSSLLATGGLGDPSKVGVASPSASAGKPTLGV